MADKNDVITAVVEGLGSGGEGVCKVGGVTYFIPYALPNEKISFKVLKIKNGIGYGRLEEIYTPSEDRVIRILHRRAYPR